MKDSRIEWIGDIPKHWDVQKLKFISGVELSSVDRHEHTDEKHVKICHYPNVYKNEYIDSKSILPTGTCSAKEYERFSLRSGDILLTKDSESPEDIGIPTLVLETLDNTVCGYHLAIIRTTSSDFNQEYIYRYIESKNVKDYFYISSNGITRFGLSKGSIENLPILAPPLAEQRLISRYLDKKTSQIDSLVEKIQKKIVLLKEQRTSLINHCVTKGLDPNVEMKESGVEWIGDIPKHWEVQKLKFISSIELSSVDRHEHDDEKRVQICHYTDVYKNEYINSKSVLPTGTCSDKEYERFSLRSGDILLTKDSESPEDIGIPTLILENLANTVCGYHLAIVRITSSDFNQEYIYRYIESKIVKDYFYISSSGITRFGLGKGSIETLPVLAPPKEEQIRISNKISSLTSTTNKISERLLKRINLLKEYRQSLISSAVTGKIRITEEML